MKHPSILIICLAAFFVELATPAAFSSDQVNKPNVLFIAVDDLNCRTGCYGDPIARTPNLDRLASRGVRFDRAYCQQALCNPSRISLLLGRYPTTTETVDFARPALLGRDWVSLTEHFRQNGYHVELIGKIYHYSELTPWSRGEDGVRKQQEMYRKNIADLLRWEYYRSLAPPTTDRVENLRTMANVYRPVPDAEAIDAETNAKDYQWTADVKSANQTVKLLQQFAKEGTPFFMGVGFFKPHVPLVAPQRFFNLFPPEKMPLPEDFAPTPTAAGNVPRYALRYNIDLFHEERPTSEQPRTAASDRLRCSTTDARGVGTIFTAGRAARRSGQISGITAEVRLHQPEDRRYAIGGINRMVCNGAGWNVP